MSKHSRKKVQGKGTNDMPVGYCTGPEKPIYGMWNNVLERTTGGKNDAFYKRRPWYRGTTICDEWLLLSTFVAWVKSHDNWQGKALDKDVLCPGNKHYSPETCVLISESLNNLLTGRDAKRGDCPKGVVNSQGRFRARVGGNGKRMEVGSFDTKGQAHKAYCIAKGIQVREVAESLTDADTCDIERTRIGLLEHAIIEENAWKFI